MVALQQHCMLITDTENNIIIILQSLLFMQAGPTTWSSLPHYLQDPALSFGSFKKVLKIHLFNYQDMQRIRRPCVMCHKIYYYYYYYYYYYINAK